MAAITSSQVLASPEIRRFIQGYDWALIGFLIYWQIRIRIYGLIIQDILRSMYVVDQRRKIAEMKNIQKQIIGFQKIVT